MAVHKNSSRNAACFIVRRSLIVGPFMLPHVGCPNPKLSSEGNFANKYDFTEDLLDPCVSSGHALGRFEVGDMRGGLTDGVRLELGILPMRGSPPITSSQARMAASSKSGAFAGSTCQPVTSLPSTSIERMFGKSRFNDAWCSTVVASHTPLSDDDPASRAESAQSCRPRKRPSSQTWAVSTATARPAHPARTRKEPSCEACPKTVDRASTD